MASQGASIAILSRAFDAGEVGAAERLRALLEGRGWEASQDAAALRYWLRTVARLGLVAAPCALLVATLGLLRPHADAGIQLSRICAALEQGELPSADGWPRELRAQAASRVVLRVLRDLRAGEPWLTVLIEAAHGTARLAPAGAARALVYKRILDACCAGLEPRPSAAQAGKLLEQLQQLGVVALRAASASEPLLSAIAAVLRQPLQQQPEALAAVLEASDEVIEVYATDDELARLLAAW